MYYCNIPFLSKGFIASVLLPPLSLTFYHACQLGTTRPIDQHLDAIPQHEQVPCLEIKLLELYFMCYSSRLPISPLSPPHLTALAAPLTARARLRPPPSTSLPCAGRADLGGLTAPLSALLPPSATPSMHHNSLPPPRCRLLTLLPSPSRESGGVTVLRRERRTNCRSGEMARLRVGCYGPQSGHLRAVGGAARVAR